MSASSEQSTTARPFDTPASVEVHHVLHGRRITPPTFEHLPYDEQEDALIDWAEDFQFTLGGRIVWRCSADGSRVSGSTVSPTQEQFCERGYHWIRACTGLDNVSRSEIDPYWRQVP